MENTILRNIDERDLKKIVINQSATFLEAMHVIDEGAAKIAVVVDHNQNVSGVITDGDLRRGLLGGATLSDGIAGIVPTEFHSVREGTGRCEALDLMKCFGIEQLPVIDAKGKLSGLHLLNRLVQPEHLPNAAMVLAGGKGTRLGALTKHIPKPMIQVAGRPILERILLHLVGGGITEIYLSVNYLSSVIESFFGNGEQFGCKITYLREEEPLGTGGALALLQDKKIREPLLVMNGDLVTNFSVTGILGCHSNNHNFITIGARTYSHEIPFGCLQLEGDRVTSLTEKPVHREIINAGIYVLDSNLVASVAARPQPMTDLIESAFEEHRRIGFYEIDDWIDVGVPEQLAAARGLE